MILVDVNVLVNAFRGDAPRHGEARSWLEELVYSEGSFGLADLVLSGYLRVVTHPRVFDPPTPLAEAMEFAQALRGQPNCIHVSPGRRHWDIFTRLCREAEARGNLIPDAYLAALAIESGSEWVTTDRDFSRFPGLRWRAPY
jgi:toxin-antitoxin system PIN domain toxin